MRDGTTEWWQHYLVLPSEPQQKATWTAVLGMYRYMLSGYRRLSVKRKELK